MSYSLAVYENKKTNVLVQLEKMKELALEMEVQQSVKELTETIASLKNEAFELIVVGEFSNGKSTFINALLGASLLPSSPKPTTAILNKIHFRNDPKFTLHFWDDKRKPLDVEESVFKRIVAPDLPEDGDKKSILMVKKSEELIKSISHSEIGYPAPICENNITIIDSPGTNDLDPAREAITNHYIPKSDAAIIILNATRPMAESEMSFIKDRILSADIHKLFFVINFKDYIRKVEEQEKVYDYIKEQLEKVIENPKVYMVSSWHALLNRKKAKGEEIPPMRRKLLPLEETGFLSFEEGLLSFLQYERGAAKLDKPIKRGSRLANDLIEKHIEFERLTLNNNIQDLQEQTEQLLKQLKQTRVISQETGRRINFRLQQQGQEIKRWYEGELRKIARTADSTFETSYYKGCNIDSVRRKIENEIAPLEKNLHEKMEEKIKHVIIGTIQVENKQLDQHLDKFAEQYRKVLLSSSSSNQDNDFISRYIPSMINGSFIEKLPVFLAMTILTGGFVGIIVGGIAFVGMVIFQGLQAIGDWITGFDRVYHDMKEELDRRFHKPIREKLENFEKQWATICEKVNTEYNEQVEQQIKESEQQLDILTKNNKLTEQEIEDSLKRLDQQEKSLKEMIHSLEESQIQVDKVGVLL
ncbi:dynamin family protein [Cytobacillus suaedae]|nr:dynamin family protein [Cytobacillus suaedae]